MLDSNWSVEEYFEIRDDVQEYLNSDTYKNNSSYQRLNSSHKKVVSNYANLVYENSKLIEPTISRDMQILVSDLDGYLVSFDHRLKTVDSIRRKIIADSKDYNGSYHRAALNLCDSVRYTIVIDDHLYVDKVDDYLHKLEDMGYLVLDVKNNWGKAFYQGINTRIVAKNHEDIFEVQFHTPVSYQIKEKNTRDLYLVIRDEFAPLELQVRANKLRKLLQTRVVAPENAKEYQYDPDVKRR